MCKACLYYYAMLETETHHDSTESRLLRCECCGKPQAGRVTNDGAILPRGVLKCRCGCRDFRLINSEELGLEPD